MRFRFLRKFATGSRPALKQHRAKSPAPDGEPCLVPLKMQDGSGA